MLTLTLKRSPTVPLEAEVLTPDRLSKLSLDDIRGSQVFHGKRQCRLDEFFEVSGQPSDQVHLHGDLHKVRWIGRGMISGSLRVSGSVGMHLGAHMRGGTIEVSGDASDWIGAEMRGGTIRVGGNAGGQAGAAYRGALRGMRGGTIVIEGDVGLEVGLRMRRGLIVIGGVARDFTGLQMKGGTIVLIKGAELRTGAWMNRGTIVSLRELQLMPTFRPSGSYNSSFLRVLAKHLSPLNIDLPTEPTAGSYQRFVGDSAVPGKGEILVWRRHE